MSAPRWKPSVTVAAVIERDGRFLLIEEHTPEGLRLNNPAGHLEQGETPLQAVCREALEETARVFEPQHLLGVYLARFQRASTGEDVTYLRLAYAGSCGEPIAGRALDEGIVRTLWMSADEVRTSVAHHRSPLVLQCIEDHIAGIRLPLGAISAHPSVWAGPGHPCSPAQTPSARGADCKVPSAEPHLPTWNDLGVRDRHD